MRRPATMRHVPPRNAESPLVKDMNRNRHNVARDVTTRMIQREARPSDARAWLRTLHELRTLPEVAV